MSDHDTETLEEQIEEKLKKLGDSPDVVAESLNNFGIRGKKLSPSSCPIALYLREFAFIPEDCNLAALGSYISVWNSIDVKVTCPPAVQTFINRFDVGGFPFLEEDPDE